MEKIATDETIQISENEKAEPQESPISELNEDCLINVFKYLSIKERIVSERGIFIYFLRKFFQLPICIFN